MRDLQQARYKWGTICDKINSAKYNTEYDFESALDLIFSLFLNWNVDRQKSFSIGNRNKIRPDILLRDAQNNVCVVVEVKARDVVVSTSEIEQLQSYLLINQASFGLLIGDHISVMYNPLTDAPIKLIDIPFDKNNEDGAKLIAEIDATSFDSGSFKELCREFKGRLRIQDEAEKIIALLTGEDGISIMSDALKSSQRLEAFNSMSIDIALKNIKLHDSRAEKISIRDDIPTELPRKNKIKTTNSGAERIDLLSENISLTGRKPDYIVINGNKFPSSNWKDVARTVLQRLYDKDPSALMHLKYVIRRDLIDTYPRKLITPKPLEGTEYIWETNFSSMDLLRLHIIPAAKLMGIRKIDCYIH